MIWLFSYVLVLLAHLKSAVSGILDQAHIRQSSQAGTEVDSVHQNGHYYSDHDSICIILKKYV